ncbi:MAG TPA: lipid-A-disaccharide synthase [Geobacteraceae bacterium]|nr:lipid-A-disaccharide synthase [Geobacteraceae bacterium]
MIIAGEASGDMYGAKLVEEAHRLDSSVRFFGIGGQAMRSAGVETLVDSREMAVMGFVEVVAHFGVIYRAFRRMEALLQQEKPDLLILIDYPGFNLRLAAVAKRAGVKVLYFITPQVWAWHASRARKIARLVDHAAVILPFEVPIFEREGLPVTFVGHPLLEMAVPSMSREHAQQQFGLAAGQRTIGLFPGSRRREINSLLPVMLESAALLKDRFADLQFILPLAPGLDRKLVDDCLAAARVEVTVIEGKNYDVIQVCDLIIAASGTVTMEIALFGVPMVIVYKVAPLSYAIGKRLVQVEHAGICNIIAGERVVPELIQHEAEPGRIVAEVESILTDRQRYDDIRKKLLGVREKLGEPGAPGRVASIAMKIMDGRK